jgi:hypothetical protein
MTSSLKGKILISMPGMVDSTFADSLVFLCAHSDEGAMGLIINKPMPGLNFMELADRLDLTNTSEETRMRLEQTPILMGGPVDQHRGFVLHSSDYQGGDGSLAVTPAFHLTATLDILQDMAEARGPSGWSSALVMRAGRRVNWKTRFCTMAGFIATVMPTCCLHPTGHKNTGARWTNSVWTPACSRWMRDMGKG